MVLSLSGLRHVSTYPLRVGGRVLILALLEFLLKERPWPLAPNSLFSPSLTAEVFPRVTWTTLNILAWPLVSSLEICFNKRIVSRLNASMSIAKTIHHFVRRMYFIKLRYWNRYCWHNRWAPKLSYLDFTFGYKTLKDFYHKSGIKSCMTRWRYQSAEDHFQSWGSDDSEIEQR